MEQRREGRRKRGRVVTQKEGKNHHDCHDGRAVEKSAREGRRFVDANGDHTTEKGGERRGEKSERTDEGIGIGEK